MALCSENMNKKVNYDRFLEKLAIYVVDEFKYGDSIVEVTKDPNAAIVDDFQKENKPEELRGEAKESTVNVETHKEQTKGCLKNLKQLKSNLKNLHGTVSVNREESMKTMIRTD